MQTTIRNIAEVRTGYTFRKASSPVSTGGLFGLQIGNIKESDIVDLSKLDAIEWQGKEAPPILKPGDVVLAAKGSHNKAAIFPDTQAPVVPSNQFLILSMKAEAPISAEFLCWYLNFHTTQSRLAEFQTGTKILSLSKKVFLEFEIALPAKAIQKKILGLSRLWQEERRATEALLENRKSMLNGVFKALLSGAVE